MQAISATKQHCKLCFDTLIAKLTGAPKPDWPANLEDAQTPIFITWKIDGDLRGCIGTFAPDKHSKIIPQYAVIAALNDDRFNPMTIEEIDEKLSVNVSLLVEFEEAKDIYDWEVGKHGIIIKLNHKGRNYSGTYLPEVATEQQWNKQQALKSLLKKAGCREQLKDVDSLIKLTRYQSSKASLSYTEYTKL